MGKKLSTLSILVRLKKKQRKKKKKKKERYSKKSSRTTFFFFFFFPHKRNIFFKKGLGREIPLFSFFLRKDFSSLS